MAISRLVPFILSTVISLAFIPLIRWLSFRTNKVAIPRHDRWHRKPTPSLGGIGIFSAFTITLILSYLIYGESIGLVNRLSLLLGIVIMFFVGVYDDFMHINPPVKLFFQIIASTIVIFFGHNTIDFFRWPIANIFLTLFWLVGITNAINLLDNMDGLAGGISFIASIFLSIFFWTNSNQELFIIAIAFAGSVLGFLIFNFPPAKIFMGDSGSMVLGFGLAALAIARRTQASNILAIIGVPALIFLLPILDTSLVTITRILRGQSPAIGGTDHTSHRLVAFGLTERQAVLVLYGIAVISGIVSVGIEAWDYDLSLVFIPIFLIGLSLFGAYLARMKVVTTEQNQGNEFTRWLTNFTYKRRIFELIFDFVLVGVSYYLSFWTRYGLNMTTISMDLFLRSWPIVLVITYGSFYLFGIYKGLWRYIGINDLIRFIMASILSGLFGWILIKFTFRSLPYTADIFLLFFMYLLVGLAGSRTSFQVFDRIYNRQMKTDNNDNVLLYGAEDAGEIALRWILRNPTYRYRVVGFLDDDSLKWGSNIHGINILGDVDNLKQFIKDKNVQGVIATTESLLNTESGEKLIKTCKENAVWVRVLKLDFELTN